MLGKLIKHEWKSTYRMGCLLLFITLMVTFLGWLSFQSPMWRQMGDDYNYRFSFHPLDFLSIIVLFMYAFMLVGIIYAAQIYLGVHFYKTMYTDQGYLTHTLPVGKHELLGSKTLVSGLWMLIVYAAVILSGVLVISSMLRSVMPNGYTWYEFWDEMSLMMGELFEIFGLDYGFYYVLMFLSAILGPFVSVAILFGGITLGQLFHRARALMAVLCYLGVCLVNSLIASVVQSVVMFNVWEYDTVMNVSTYSSLAVQTLVAVLLYFISYQIITKKLNME